MCADVFSLPLQSYSPPFSTLLCAEQADLGGPYHGPPCPLAFSWVSPRGNPNKKSKEGRRGLGYVFSFAGDSLCLNRHFFTTYFDWVIRPFKVSALQVILCFWVLVTSSFLTPSNLIMFFTYYIYDALASWSLADPRRGRDCPSLN